MATRTATLKRKANDASGSDSERLKRARLDANDATLTEKEIPSLAQAGKTVAESTKKEQLNPTPTFKRKKLAPPRPYPTVPASVSATGPRSAHHEKKNYIAITRKTKLAAYLRRCKDLVIKDGSV